MRSPWCILWSPRAPSFSKAELELQHSWLADRHSSFRTWFHCRIQIKKKYHTDLSTIWTPTKIEEKGHLLSLCLLLKALANLFCRKPRWALTEIPWKCQGSCWNQFWLYEIPLLAAGSLSAISCSRQRLAPKHKLNPMTFSFMIYDLCLQKAVSLIQMAPIPCHMCCHSLVIAGHYDTVAKSPADFEAWRNLFDLQIWDQQVLSDGAAIRVQHTRRLFELNPFETRDTHQHIQKVLSCVYLH